VLRDRLHERQRTPPKGHERVEEDATMSLSTLWSRLVGLTGWNKEARLLHNVEGDDVPPPGETEVTQPSIEESRPGTAAPATDSRDHDQWQGTDPGH
jgi:hypothetical protein